MEVLEGLLLRHGETCLRESKSLGCGKSCLCFGIGLSVCVY